MQRPPRTVQYCTDASRAVCCSRLFRVDGDAVPCHSVLTPTNNRPLNPRETTHRQMPPSKGIWVVLRRSISLCEFLSHDARAPPGNPLLSRAASRVKHRRQSSRHAQVTSKLGPAWHSHTKSNRDPSAVKASPQESMLHQKTQTPTHQHIERSRWSNAPSFWQHNHPAKRPRTKSPYRTMVSCLSKNGRIPSLISSLESLTPVPMRCRTDSRSAVATTPVPSASHAWHA
mmetsp:Transcript_35433/g.79298  ORF Transcript_35433/g.79298 Transcript_35433/m.79298 type:complete len:229 (+) Transcript_35433:1013-1699(+)